MAGQRANNILNLERYSLLFLLFFTPEIDLLLFPWARQRKRINPISGSRPKVFRSVQYLLSLLFVSFALDSIHQLSLQTPSGCAIDHLRPDGGYHCVCMLSAVSARVRVHRCALHGSLNCPPCCWPLTRVQQRAAARRLDKSGTASSW
jgi:hypothetical protein